MAGPNKILDAVSSILPKNAFINFEGFLTHTRVINPDEFAIFSPKYCHMTSQIMDDILDLSLEQPDVLNLFLSKWPNFPMKVKPVYQEQYLQHRAMLFNLVALHNWRLTKKIYRFDETVFKYLAETKTDSGLPAEVIYRLPDWCIYIETPNSHWYTLPYAEKNKEPETVQIYGIFCYIDHFVDERDGHDVHSDDLIIIPNPGTKYLSDFLWYLRIPIGDLPLIDGLHQLALDVNANNPTLPASVRRNISIFNDPDLLAQSPYIKLAQKFIPLVLYLCSDLPDLSEPFSAKGASKKKKLLQNSQGYVEPKKVKIINVGNKVGQDIRKAEQAHNLAISSSSSDKDERKTPAPHIRKAHWHGYWRNTEQAQKSLEKPDKEFFLRWLSPTFVGLKTNEQENDHVNN